MALPLFPPERDPGPDFVGLLRMTSGQADTPARSLDSLTPVQAPHGTTVVALRYLDGVVMAGDRRATAGNIIAHHAMQKVFPADRFSAVAIAGTAGMAIEMVRLFQVQLEHYEKVEGATLSLEGKANRLGKMIRDNLMAAMQGLAVIPLFAGYDEDAGVGRIFSYDVAGGPYEEHRFHSIGSGSLFAKSALKKRYRPGLTRAEAVQYVIEALFDAADDDTATGGPDLVRQIFPIVMSATAEGTTRLPDDEVSAATLAIVAARTAAGG